MKSELPVETIMAAVDGDRRSFRSIHEHYEPVVTRAVVSRVRRRPTLLARTDDLVAEVWLYLVAGGNRVLRRWQPQMSPFSYYLRMVSMRRVGHLIGRADCRELDLLPPGWSAVIDATVELEPALIQRDRLMRLCGHAEAILRGVDRELFVRVLVEGHRVTDVAEELSLTEDAAYQRIHRMRARLAQRGDSGSSWSRVCRMRT